MKAYFDTSYLVALYVPQVHTAAALRHLARSGREPIPFTPLHRLELRTTVRQCAYVGLIQQSDARRILHSIEEDLDDGTLLHQPLDWTGSLRRAEEVAGWTLLRDRTYGHTRLAVYRLDDGRPAEGAPAAGETGESEERSRPGSR